MNVYNLPCCIKYSLMNVRIPQITCRGVSHTPENIHVDKRVHSGVCDTPLHWLFEDIHLFF